MNKRKKGFTLVELSIVLVIIGLLIGGILAAQSMINTAKIQSLVRQVGQFDAAVENFQTKFGQLPGDTNLMGTQVGNNDGVITDGGGNNYFSYEIGKFWSDLSNSGMTNPNGAAYIDGSAGAVPDFTYVPKAQNSTTGEVLVVGSPISKNNYYLITQTYQPNGATLQSLSGVFKIIDIQAFDTKIDDGLTNSGNVNGWGGDLIQNNGSTTDYLENPNGHGSCSTGGGATGYGINFTYLCSIRIRIGTSTGNLK